MNIPFINIENAFEHEPPELDFIWPGFLAGTVGALVAPGAAGKSFWTLEATMSIACSVAGGDLLGLEPKKAGRVVYLAGEDPEAALVRRVNAIGKHLSVSAQQSIAENLSLASVMGKGLNVMNKQSFTWVIDHAKDARLIVLDTLSRVHCLDENSNGDMSRLVTTLEQIAVVTGASVLYLHHVNKMSVRDGLSNQQQSARGASALIDNARWCGFVAKMAESEAKTLSDQINTGQPIGNDRRESFVRFGVSKQNYASPYSDRWFERRGGGVLVPVGLSEAGIKKINSTKKSFDQRKPSDHW